MENLSKFWAWLKTLPVWLRAIVLVLIAALTFIASMSFCSCGTPRTTTHTTIHGNAGSSSVSVTTTVTSSPSTTTNTTANPSIK